MEESIVDVWFPLGSIPVRGFRCPVCHRESMLDEQLSHAQRLARTLGLYGLEGEQVRKLQQTGSSLAVTLDPAWIRDILGGAKAGATVRIARQGDRIIVLAAN